MIFCEFLQFSKAENTKSNKIQSLNKIKKEKFARKMYSRWKSSNQLLSNSFVNALISRNFCQKGVRVNFRNFHTVLCAAQCVEICKVFPQDFCKNSVNLTFSLKSYTVILWGKIFEMTTTTLWKYERLTLSNKIFRQTIDLVISLV